jgi:DNA modification methylase
MSNIIKVGDTSALIQELADESIDTLVTRLPRPQKGEGSGLYSERGTFYDDSPLLEKNYPHWLRSLLYHVWFKLKENGNVLLQVQTTASNQCAEVISRARGELQRGGWFECEKFIWANDAGRLLQNMGPWRQYEEILWFRKNNTVTQYRIEKKVEGLYESLIGTFSQPGDTILDPFAGMGDIVTTAHKMGRKFVAYEKDADTAIALKLKISTLTEEEE